MSPPHVYLVTCTTYECKLWYLNVYYKYSLVTYSWVARNSVDTFLITTILICFGFRTGYLMETSKSGEVHTYYVLYYWRTQSGVKIRKNMDFSMTLKITKWESIDVPLNVIVGDIASKIICHICFGSSLCLCTTFTCETTD